MFVWPVFLSISLLLTNFDDVGVVGSSEIQQLKADEDVSPVEKAVERRKRSFIDQGDEKPKYNLTYCSFNFDLCGFDDYFNKDTRLGVTRRIKLNRANIQPIVDRTWGTAGIGAFVAVDYSKYTGYDSIYDRGSPSSTASLKSPFFGPADHYCLRFWYNLKYYDRIIIDVSTEIDNGLSYSVIDLTTTEAKWKLAQVDFDEEYSAEGLKIVFTFRIPARPKRHTPLPYAAIDDVYVYNVPCSDVPIYPVSEYAYRDEGSTSFYTFHVERKTWKDAYTTCRKEGATSFLVSVQTKEEQEYLVRKIKSDGALSQAGKKGGFYTSGNDIGSERTFMWSGTLENEKFNYTNWKTGQPNNVKGNQDCMVLQYWAEDYSWGDKDCSKLLPFICEVNAPQGDDEYVG